MSQAGTPNTNDGLTILDAFDAFYREYYKQEINELATRYPNDQTSLTIEFEDIWNYDPAIADDWRSHPREMAEHAEEALAQFDLAVDVDLSEASVRVTDTQEYIDRKEVAGLSHQDLGTLVAIRGQLNRVSDTIPLLTRGAFECMRCGVLTEVPQFRTSGQEPHECSGCERQGPFQINVAESEWTDVRKCLLEEPPEEQVNTRGEQLSVFVDGDLVHAGGKNGLPDRSGERVTIVGELTLQDKDILTEGDGGPEGEMYLDASAIVFDESDRDDIDVEAHREEIEALKERAGDGLIEDYRDSIAPDIIAKGDDDLEVAMEALVAYLFNAYRADPDALSSSRRGDIHIGIIGDPGKGKSTILSQVAKLSPESEFRSGSGVTKVGLTAAARQQEFFGKSEWTLEPGILPRANGGHCIIDEIDDVVDDDTKAIHDALEDPQMVKADKAGISADLPTRTAVCVSGNPAEGRFEKYGAPFAEQVDMDPALISRMDALFALQDIPDPEHDRDVARHVLDSWDELTKFEIAERKADVEAPTEAETIDPPISADVFQAAIVEAQDTIFPTLTEEAKDMLEEYYVDVRQLNDDDGGDGDPVPATARTLEAGIRLSTAFARSEFCEDVLPRHAERAINISRNVVGLNFDPESGKFDAGRTDTGKPKSQKERRRKLQELIESEQPDDGNDGVPVEEIKDIADERWGIEGSQVDHDLEQMKNSKNACLIEPRAEEVRKI